MTDETVNEETASEESVETPEEALVEVANEATDMVIDNSKHETLLFTGSLGGHVLLDSATSPDGGVLMGAVLGTPPSGVPGASQFSALQHKQVG